MNLSRRGMRYLSELFQGRVTHSYIARICDKIEVDVELSGIGSKEERLFELMKNINGRDELSKFLQILIIEYNGRRYIEHINDILRKDGYSVDEYGNVKLIPKREDMVTNKKPSIFLSHSWEDKFFVRKLGEKLQENGVKVWIDEAVIKVGDSLIEKISEGIEKSDFIGAILSPNSVSSSWVQKELGLAMTQEIKGKKVKILPIILEKCDIPDFLKDKLYADFTESDDPKKFNKELLKILTAIGIKKKTVFTPPKKIYVVDDTKEIKIKVVKPEDALADFEDIKITDLDKNRMYKPDPKKDLYHVPFILSRTPPSEWNKIFDSERKFPRHTRWRKAWVDNQYIIVHCSLDEIKSVHFNDIKQDVSNTNKKYREYLLNRAYKRKKEMERKGEEQKKINESTDGLKFD